MKTDSIFYRLFQEFPSIFFELIGELLQAVKLYLTRHPYPENIFWLIEYSYSSLSKDLETKRKIYAQAEIPEYWIVDLKNRLVKILRNPVDGDYQFEVTLSQGEVSPLAFSEIVVSVQRLLEG